VKITELKEIRSNLDVFLLEFDDCIKTVNSRNHFRTYTGGQLSDLERKSVEPIALEAGVPPRSLQEFLSIHRWDDGRVRRRVQDMVMRDHANENAVGVIDETSFPKKGDKTAGVQRQYCGATGKTDNCVVTVNLGYNSGDFHALVDTDLYLPEGAWDGDRDRCRDAGIPDDVVYRPKWRIALDLLKRSMDNGMRFKWLTADEFYGCSGPFRRGLEALGLSYVVEVPRSTCGWLRKPPTLGPADSQATGRPRTRVIVSPAARAPRRVDELWLRGGPSWEAFHIKDTEKGPLVWEARIGDIYMSQGAGTVPKKLRLIVARNVLDGEIKYFLCAAPRDTPPEVILHVAFSRWRIERIFEDAKGQIGMDHFEVRHYRPLMRHMILSMVSLLFLMRETKRLRGKKYLVERAPGAPRRRSTACPAHIYAREGAPIVENRRQNRI
jgi:SRSO17 transposase